MNAQIASNHPSAFFDTDQTKSGTVLFAIEAFARVRNIQPADRPALREFDANVRPPRMFTTALRKDSCAIRYSAVAVLKGNDQEHCWIQT